MKLPLGLITKNVNGGKESIQSLFGQFAGSRFTGYLEVKRTVKKGECVGQLVFKEGTPVLAEHSIAKKSKAGKDCLRSLVKSFITPKAVITVHENIDADMMVTFFNYASINPPDLDLDRIIKEIELKTAKKKA